MAIRTNPLLALRKAIYKVNDSCYTTNLYEHDHCMSRKNHIIFFKKKEYLLENPFFLSIQTVDMELILNETQER